MCLGTDWWEDADRIDPEDGAALGLPQITQAFRLKSSLDSDDETCGHGSMGFGDLSLVEG